MHIRFLILIVIALSVPTLFVSHSAQAQSNTYLPIYQVTQAGATYSQATNLANYLGIPTNTLEWSNGLISYVDTTNFMAVPSMTLTNTNNPVISNLITRTKNPYPAIPITVQAIDFAALSNLTVYNSNAAMASASNALAAVGLTPQFGAPAIGHTVFTAFMTNTDNSVTSAHQYLDTMVHYQFAIPDGTNFYPLIGGGAQAQLSFGSNGSVTCLYYTAPQLIAGPSVQIISPTVASNRVAALLSPNAQFNLQLVYWAPSLLAPLSSAPGTWSPTNILPYYLYTARTPPSVGSNTLGITQMQMIPATDDTNYIPSINLSASVVGGNQLAASASACGGQPPYTYVWGGSSPILSTNTGASINYTPIVRVGPPPLAITLLASNASIRVSWPYPSTGFILESTSNLVTAAWSQVGYDVQTNAGMNMVTLPNSSDLFLRLRLTNQTLPATETVNVAITDANGVLVHASQTVAVQAEPITFPIPHPPPGQPNPTPTYGTESPYDVGQFTTDSANWVNAMATYDAGAQNFLWTQYSAWPGDFVEPSPAGQLEIIEPYSSATLGGTPTAEGPPIYADADFTDRNGVNYGVNTANFVLYMGHANANSFTFTYPNYPLDGTPAYSLQVGDPDPALSTFADCSVGTEMLTDNTIIYEYNLNLDNSWGNQGPNDSLDWLGFAACQLLEYNSNLAESDSYYGADDNSPPDLSNPQNEYAWQRWGLAFNGLHMVLGYHTASFSQANTPAIFAYCMLDGFPGKPLTIAPAWFLASYATQPSSGLDALDGGGLMGGGPVVPAAMGPVGPAGAYNYGDSYPGIAATGPDIPTATVLTGWWYINAEFTSVLFVQSPPP